MNRTVARLLFPLFCVLASSAFAQTVHVVTIDGTINPASADYLHEGIANATDAGAECLVVRLNTPGGLLKSTRVMVSDLLTAKIPVVVYVSPSGAQSASAGVFITLAADIAAMAPGTNIGAAHPVGMQGGEKDSIMNEKATNDAAAFIRTISEKRHRNVRWAEDAVRKSISITETEALRDSVIDLVASSLKELLKEVDGREVTVDGRTLSLSTASADIIEREMDWRHQILNVLSDPNIAYIFFLLGIYGLMFELYNPGTILPGVVGAISLILAFYSLHTLPINYAGLALIVVGIILFILEIKITSYGLLSLGGIVALFLGSIMLVDSDSSLEFISISWGIIVPAVLLTALFFAVAIGFGIKAQRRKPTTGVEGIVGEIGEALSDLNPEGRVRVHGEIWAATSAEGKIKKGTKVKIHQIHDLRLTVVKNI
ncbi:MAG TPA: nodulation protein NfeD [Bacteroidota bacterium]|nr:nodulation protein NfeD [Bacteroidota bacterium]